jgi:sugar lactone lactonase YvrE
MRSLKWAGITRIPAYSFGGSTLVLVLFTCFALSYAWSQAGPTACDDKGGCCEAPKIGPVIPFISFNTNPTYGVEGIAISPHNDIYIGSPYEGEIHKVEPNGKATLFAKLVAQPNDGYLLGLVVAKDETLYAAVWGCNAPINGVWHIDKDGHSRLAMPMPGAFCASIPNNLAFDEDGNLYATDSGYGSVWRLGRYGDITLWAQDPLLMPITGFGANGVAYRDHSLWIDNFDQGSIVRIPINRDGSAGKASIFVKSPLLGNPDDDNFDACGNLWVGDPINGNLIRVTPEGVPEIMITAAQFKPFYWPTNPVFGFDNLRSTVFITGGNNPSVVKVDLGVPGMIPPQFVR